ncbi:hypothetical protein NP493_397g02016 [Ridgeia piscesae]|uniref:Uncharacterized protein n=1 Tax=Ridgeia piscesae TaxID=27915 RepID=A0AAD9L1R9_RIDPI|nr:hypothetical protein NP493_397g02016 [Ridgeia piscesae]
MYVIVEFALDGSIALIHEKWMTTEKSCMWPGSKSAMKIDKAVRSGMEPDSSFQAHECRVLYTSSFYDKARKKLQQAEMTSDLATEAEEETPKKRQKRPTSRYLLSDSDSDSGSAYVRQPQPTQMASPPPHQNSLLSPPPRRNSLPSPPSCRNLLPSPPPVPCGLTSPHTPTSVSGTSFLIRCIICHVITSLMHISLKKLKLDVTPLRNI